MQPIQPPTVYGSAGCIYDETTDPRVGEVGLRTYGSFHRRGAGPYGVVASGSG